MFKKIFIENFRGIHYLKIENLERINLLVGKNSSGKSTILEGIFLNIGAMNSELPLRINAFRNYTRIDDMTFRSFFHNLEVNKPIRICSEAIKPMMTRDLTINPQIKRETNGKIIKIEDVLMGEDSSESKQIISGLKHILKLRKDGSEKDREYEALLKQEERGMSMVPPKNYTESLFGVILAPRILPRDNAKRLARIQFEKREKELIQTLKEIEPELVEIKILDRDYIFADINKKNLIPFAFLGDGVNRLLTILLAIYETPNGIVLIDEIENGFHHKSLSILWKAIFSISKKQDVQVFATTHSWENVKTFAKVAKEINDESYRLYRVESNAELNKIIEYEPSLLQQSVKSEWEIR